MTHVRSPLCPCSSPSLALGTAGLKAELKHKGCCHEACPEGLGPGQAFQHPGRSLGLSHVIPIPSSHSSHSPGTQPQHHLHGTAWALQPLQGLSRGTAQGTEQEGLRAAA